MLLPVFYLAHKTILPKISTRKLLKLSKRPQHFLFSHLSAPPKHFQLNWSDWSTWTNEHSPTQINFYFNLFCDYSSLERKNCLLINKDSSLFNFCQCSNAFSMNPLMGFSRFSHENSNPRNHSTNFQFGKAFVGEEEKKKFNCCYLEWRQRSLKI